MPRRTVYVTPEELEVFGRIQRLKKEWLENHKWQALLPEVRHRAVGEDGGEIVITPIRIIDYPRNADYRLVEQGGERFIQLFVRPGGHWVRYNRTMIHSNTDEAAIKEFREWFLWKTGDPKRRGPEPALGPTFANEEEFLQDVRAQAHLHGWVTYHTRNSRGSDKGLLDLIMRRERLVWAELKMPGKQPTPEQVALMEWLKANGYEVYLWRPADMDKIVEVLTRKEVRT